MEEEENVVELNNKIILQVDDGTCTDDKVPCEAQKLLIDAIIDNEVDKENNPPDNPMQKTRTTKKRKLVQFKVFAL